MASSGMYLAIAIGAAALLGLLGTCALVRFLQERMQVHWLQKEAGAGGALYRLFARGFPCLFGPSSMILRLPLVKRSFKKIADALSLKGFNSNEQKLLSLALGLILAMSAMGALLGSWLAGLAFSICIIVALSAWAAHALEAYRDAIRDALPDAVRAMNACFHTGFTLQQTLAQLQQESSGPVAELFGKAKDEIDTGSSAIQALDGIRKSQTVPELAFIAVALEVQHRAGGSMRHVLDAACESLESELELRRSLRVHTAQARLSARTVTGVTIALVGALSLMTDNFLGPFFSSVLGFVLLLLALLMQCAGVLIVRRMLKVEVD